MKLKSGKIVQRGKYRLIFQGGRDKEPFGRARLKSGPKQKKKNCTEEKRKQGSSKTLRYEKVDVTGQAWAKMRAEAEEKSQRTSSLLVLT